MFALRCLTSYSIFQSTFLREERQNQESPSLITIKISIHVPTRGTTFIILKMPNKVIFQSTFLREERQDCDGNEVVKIKFQSTFLREERRYAFIFTQQMGNFNPRSYERNDLFAQIIYDDRSNFNPRSYERNDSSKLVDVICEQRSIHVPTRGTTAALNFKEV